MTTEKEQYITFASSRPDIPVFYTPQWLDAVTQRAWDVVCAYDQGGNINAFMPVTIKKKWGIKIFTNPLLTPYQGIFFCNDTIYDKEESLQSYRKDCTDQIICKLGKQHFFKINFHPDYTFWLPFYFHGYRQTTYYSYILDNIKDHDAIFSGFRSNIKNKIRKAEGVLMLEETSDIELLYGLNQKTFEKQSLRIPFSKALLKEIIQVAGQQHKILMARDTGGNIHAAQLIIWDQRSAYNLLLGTDPALRQSGAAPFLMWHAIRIASLYTNKFDFEGSRLPAIQPFFESFGAHPVPYCQIYQTKNILWEYFFRKTNRL